MTFRIIKCDVCDFEARSTCLWGAFDYVAPDGARLNVERSYGWCYTCEDICPIEDLSDEDQLRKEIDVDTKELTDILTVNIIYKFLQLFGRDKWRIKILKEKIEENQRRLTFLNDRKSPPKCLTCSGTKNEKIILQYPQGESIEKINDFHHPNCSGNLLVKDSQYRLNIAFPIKEYDLDGLFIQDNWQTESLDLPEFLLEDKT